MCSRVLAATAAVSLFFAAGCGDDASSSTSDAGSAGTNGSAGTSGSGSAGTSPGQPTPRDWSERMGADGPCQAFGFTREELGAALEPMELGLRVSSVLSTSAGLYLAARPESGSGPAALHRIAPVASATTLVASDVVVSKGLMAANSTHLAWVGNSGQSEADVFSVPLGQDGATPTKVMDELGGSYWELTVDDTRAYAWDFFDGAIAAAPLTSGTLENLGDFGSLRLDERQPTCSTCAACGTSEPSAHRPTRACSAVRALGTHLRAASTCRPSRRPPSRACT